MVTLSWYLIWMCMKLVDSNFELLNSTIPIRQYANGIWKAHIISDENILYLIGGWTNHSLFINSKSLFNKSSSPSIWESTSFQTAPFAYKCDYNYSKSENQKPYWIKFLTSSSYTKLNDIIYGIGVYDMSITRNSLLLCNIDDRSFSRFIQYNMSSNKYISFTQYNATIPYENIFPSCLLSNDIYIYLISGYDFFIHNTQNSTWIQGSALNKRRGESGCSIYNNNIYILGGNNVNSHLGHHVESHSTNINEKDTDWIIISTYPRIHRHSCITVGILIYCIGGWRTYGDDGLSPIRSVTIFNCHTNQIINSSDIYLNDARSAPGLTLYHFDDDLENEISIVAYGGYNFNTFSLIRSFERLKVPIMTASPTEFPTHIPTEIPSFDPTSDPTYFPTIHPTQLPSVNPINSPTYFPTMYPTQLPSLNPTAIPSIYPTNIPSYNPSAMPTKTPTRHPTLFPTRNPTLFTTEDVQTSETEEMTLTIENAVHVLTYETYILNVTMFGIFCLFVGSCF